MVHSMLCSDCRRWKAVMNGMMYTSLYKICSSTAVPYWKATNFMINSYTISHQCRCGRGRINKCGQCSTGHIYKHKSDRLLHTLHPISFLKAAGLYQTAQPRMHPQMQIFHHIHQQMLKTQIT